MEMMDEGPHAINYQKSFLDKNINKDDLPATKECEKEDIPINTNFEGGQYSIQNEDLITLSTIIVTSQLRKKRNQVVRLKNEVQELKTIREGY
jgi:hypothetical protein